MAIGYNPAIMPNQETLYHVAGRVATITLNRPDKLNAWTAVMEGEVRAAMQEAERDDNIRVIVLTGAGRGFCAGADYGQLLAYGCVKKAARHAARRCTGCATLLPGNRESVRQPISKRNIPIFLLITKPVIAGIKRPGGGFGTSDRFVL